MCVLTNITFVCAEVEWVEVLLQFASPPIYCQVDGEAYGVYEIRSMSQLESTWNTKPAKTMDAFGSTSGSTTDTPAPLVSQLK